MKKNLIIFIILIIFAVIAMVYSVSLTVRKTTKAIKPQNSISSDYKAKKNNTSNDEFTLHKEMAENNDFSQNSYDINNQTQTNDFNNSYSKNQNQYNNYLNNNYINNKNNKIHSSNNNYNNSNSPDKNSLSYKIQTCKPYRETLRVQYMGIDMIYKIDIEGWQNGKCILNFETNANGIGSDFMAQYGVDPSEVNVSAFTPKIRCEFSKAQLLYVGDSLLEENSRSGNPNNKMLKNPQDITFPEPDKMQLSDLKLLDVIIRQKACKITNWNEFKSIIQELSDFLQY